MTDLDKKLLRELSDIPLIERPFKEIAERLGVDEGWVLRRTKELLSSGVIRRFGVILNHFKAGFSHNALLLWKTDNPSSLAKLFVQLPWVSHCYRRRSYPQLNYQLYTMVHAKSLKELMDKIERMKVMAGSEPLILLTKRCFKKSSFEL